jgi:fructose-bisphosphate aldolase, class I
MGLGKKIRLNRVFSHPSGRLCSVAVDHYLMYEQGIPPGLRHLRQTLAQIVEGQPDAVTMHKGIATSLWEPYAGKIPMILQSSMVLPDDSAQEQAVTVEEALHLGADAMAVVAFVRGASEAYYLRNVSDNVREGARLELPIIAHVYPRDIENGLQVIYRPEDIAWAVRCMVEVGVDVVKVPYCGDPVAHAQIVADCPVPLVAAGGPKAPTLLDGLQMMSDAIHCGVQGATIGRNIWGVSDVTGAVRAFKAVIHDKADARDAHAAISQAVTA